MKYFQVKPVDTAIIRADCYEVYTEPSFFVTLVSMIAAGFTIEE